ncbi:MAG: glycosyltransferase [Cytophagaceae bacterium]|nr:glycosyltransferase [Cytophagaceae bacterium]MBL0300217.1 glycosyltransferase [Cytophagaceae bacterium]MBL0327154.1 glycosyltransferase [Cytophagaceae bacterium]
MISLIFIIYFIFLFIGIFIWLFFVKPNDVGTSQEGSKFSVIIPVRNESENISRLLKSLENQSLGSEKFEVILVDDQSDDDTKSKALQFFENSKLNWRILDLNPDERGKSPKKNAITKAINYSHNELVFCTDGDCELPNELLSEYQKVFDNKEVMFISGPVSFFDVKSRLFRKLWNKIQIVEFASLVGVGGSSIFVGSPNMCSGANIAYRKVVFFEVKGYDGNEHLASGDDEFLMHKIAQKYPGSIRFSGGIKSLVLTNDSKNLTQFFNQRIRWASKWSFYKSLVPKILAIYVFVLNLGSIYLLMSGFWFWLIARAIFEFIFLVIILTKFKKISSIIIIPLVQFIYPFYVVFFGIKSFFSNKKYSWKSRELS